MHMSLKVTCTENFCILNPFFLLDFRVMIVSHRMSDGQGEAARHNTTRLHKKLMTELGLKSYDI